MTRPLRLTAKHAMSLANENETLLSCLDEHGLIVVSGFAQDINLFKSIAAALGVPETVSPPAFALAGYSTIRVQSNQPGRGVSGGGEYWHSDGPWSKNPSAATLLLCEIAPERGGETLFTDMRTVADTLLPMLEDDLNGLIGNYPCRSIYLRELEQMGLKDPDKLTVLQDLTHPLIRHHPSTGRRALYLNEMWLESIVGMSARDSKSYLSKLLSIATTPTLVYAHRWKVGDLLIWDNVSMMHKALPPQEGATKTTFRMTIRG